MAVAYTDDEKRIFARKYAATHNLSEAYREIRPKASNTVASTCGRRLLNLVELSALIKQYEDEINEEARKISGQRLLDAAERKKALADLVERNIGSVDMQAVNAALKAMDILNKMEGNYIEKRQVEITTSLAEILKGVDEDA